MVFLSQHSLEQEKSNKNCSQKPPALKISPIPRCNTPIICWFGCRDSTCFRQVTSSKSHISLGIKGDKQELVQNSKLGFRCDLISSMGYHNIPRYMFSSSQHLQFKCYYLFRPEINFLKLKTQILTNEITWIKVITKIKACIHSI